MSIDRRRFLVRSATGLGALGAGAALGGRDATAAPPARAVAGLARRIPFDGPHQAGIVTAPGDQATHVALDAIAPDRATLIGALRTLTDRARSLTQGGPIAPLARDDPPSDSGVLGATNAPDGLTVTIAFGASLFDHRYGLADIRPRRLRAMPRFPNDDIDDARAHGDVLLQIAAGHRDTVVHTLRELMRTVRGAFALRWTVDGFQGADRGPSPRSSRRNLFAFRDGTANPDTANAKLMNDLIWVQPATGEPAWATGGTYQVVRTIRMHVEFWDRVGLAEQENMIGRRRDTGAPLGGETEFENPRYDLDPKGDRIPLDAHIRLANPRTAATANQRLLRRGWNYHRGFDEAGQLDQGLLFVAFNQDIERQFAVNQKRLADEPMVDYITPVGGGYFFVPPGARGPGDWVGSGAFS